MREAGWERKAARTDVIHHCGAEVDFLYPYEKPRAANVFDTQEVLRLAARRAIPVHHVSTMSVVLGMGVAVVRRVPEDPGNETTKNATTGDPMAFSRNPDRWHLLRRQLELLDPAVEEILRCVWVASAKRDEEVFTEPDTYGDHNQPGVYSRQAFLPGSVPVPPEVRVPSDPRQSRSICSASRSVN